MKQKTLLSGATVALISFFLLVMIVAASPLQQTAQDGSHSHPMYETALAQNRATDVKQSTEIAILRSTDRASPLPPTQEILTDTNTPTATFFNATNTPTRTSTPLATSTPRLSVTSSPSAECQANADFVPNVTINRRNAPSISGTLIQPQLVAGRIEVVCIETLTPVDSQGFRWIQVAETTNPEFFAIGRMENGVFNSYGILTSWGQ